MGLGPGGTSRLAQDVLAPVEQVLIRWPINRSNRLSDFLRLDRLDRSGKIIKSIFPKFWMREFQFFPDFQNFFGFFEVWGIFFGMYSRFPVDLASVVVTSTDVDREILGSKPTITIWILHKLKTKYIVFLKVLLPFTRIWTTYISFFDVKFGHSNLQEPFCELLSHTTSLYLMIFVTGSCKKWRSGILWPQ